MLYDTVTVIVTNDTDQWERWSGFCCLCWRRLQPATRHSAQASSSPSRSRRKTRLASDNRQTDSHELFTLANWRQTVLQSSDSRRVRVDWGKGLNLTVPVHLMSDSRVGGGWHSPLDCSYVHDL